MDTKIDRCKERTSMPSLSLSLAAVRSFLFFFSLLFHVYTFIDLFLLGEDEDAIDRQREKERKKK